MNPTWKSSAARYYNHPDMPCTKHDDTEEMFDGRIKYVSHIPFPETPDYGVLVTTVYTELDIAMYSVVRVEFSEGKTIVADPAPTTFTYCTDVDAYIDSLYVHKSMTKSSYASEIQELLPAPF